MLPGMGSGRGGQVDLELRGLGDDERPEAARAVQDTALEMPFLQHSSKQHGRICIAEE